MITARPIGGLYVQVCDHLSSLVVEAACHAVGHLHARHAHQQECRQEMRYLLLPVYHLS